MRSVGRGRAGHAGRGLGADYARRHGQRRRGSPTGKACACTSSPARAAPARPRSPPPSPWPWPARAAAPCSSRSRTGRASPSSSTSRRCPTRSARSPSVPAAATCSPWRRPRGGAARVPRHVLQARPGRPRAAQDRRHRLRHHHRAGHARRAAHRQGLRGRTPARRRASGRSYDAVVLDAPPTGRITRFLGVNAEVAGLAKVGPIRGQADAIMALLTSPQTAVHLVTLLEEMPVQETADAVGRATAAGLPVGGIVVNAVREPLLKVADLTAAAKGRLPARRGGGGAGGRGRRRPRPARSTRCWPRPPSTPSGSRWRRPSDAPSRRSADRRTSCRCCPRASTSAASTTWPSGSAPRARRDGGRSRGLDLDTVIGDRRTRDRRLLRRRAASARRRPPRRWRCGRPSRAATVVVLTIDPARRLAQSMGLHRAGQHPAPGDGRRRVGRRLRSTR